MKLHFLELPIHFFNATLHIYAAPSMSPLLMKSTPGSIQKDQGYSGATEGNSYQYRLNKLHNNLLELQFVCPCKTIIPPFLYSFLCRIPFDKIGVTC